MKNQIPARPFLHLIVIVIILLASLISEAAVMVPTGLPKRTLSIDDMWYVGGGYSITVMAIDAKTNPRAIWFVFKRDGILLEEETIGQGQTFNYSNDTGLIFTTYVDSIFAGATRDFVQFKNTSISSDAIGMETTPSMVSIFSNTGTGKKTLTIGKTWNISGGFSLIVQAIDARVVPGQAWFVINKDGKKVDERVLEVNQIYNYNNLLNMRLDSVFMGATSALAQLKGVSVGISYDVARGYSWTAPADSHQEENVSNKPTAPATSTDTGPQTPAGESPNTADSGTNPANMPAAPTNDTSNAADSETVPANMPAAPTNNTSNTAGPETSFVGEPRTHEPESPDSTSPEDNGYYEIPAPTVVCGNGVVEYGEQCDGGSNCSPNCTITTSPITGTGSEKPVAEIKPTEENKPITEQGAASPSIGCSLIK